MGCLVIKEEDSLFSNNLYSKLCFEIQEKSNKLKLAKIYTSDNTSTRNFLSHAARAHEFDKWVDDDNEHHKQCKLTPWLTRVKDYSPTTSQ